MTKLTSLNAHYLRDATDEHLAGLTAPLIEQKLGRALAETERSRLMAGMAGLKERAKSLVELADSARFYAGRPDFDAKALKVLEPLKDNEKALLLDGFMESAYELQTFDRAALEALARATSEETGMKLGDIAQPLRAALTGSTTSPPIFEVMEILGAIECQTRFASALQTIRNQS